MKEAHTIKGIPASPGIALGYVHLLDRGKMAVIKRRVSGEEVENELRRFDGALEFSRQQLQTIQKRVSEEQGEEHLYLVEAQRLMLEDPSLTDEAREIIREQHINAEWAVQKALERFKTMFDKIDDEYFRDRRSDIEYVEERLLRALAGRRDQEYLSLQKKTVIVAHDLSPVDLVRMGREHLSAFATDVGGRTSHTAIISRSLGIPLVVGLIDISHHAKSGDRIIVDALDGKVILHPTTTEWSEYESRRDRFEKACVELLSNRNFKAETSDHFEVQLKANLDFLEEVGAVSENGAEAVGMLRTENLFLEGPIPVSEEEQFVSYRKIVEAVKPGEVCIRLLDLAGDKLFTPPTGMHVNLSPALGLRGIRLLLREQDLLRSQFSAILRASDHGRVAILYPMVTTAEEVKELNRVLQEVKADLTEQKIRFSSEIRVGILIETPAAALMTDVLAHEVDFLAVGTNDLIQYTFAADRTNPLVANLYEPTNPAFLHFLKGIAQKAHQAGTEIGVCGEMASDPALVPLLLGMEFNFFSMSPGTIPLVKQVVRQLSLKQCKEWLAQAMDPHAIDRDHYLKEFGAWYRERFADFSA